jgi:hypothetical protein
MSCRLLSLDSCVDVATWPWELARCVSVGHNLLLWFFLKPPTNTLDFTVGCEGRWQSCPSFAPVDVVACFHLSEPREQPASLATGSVPPLIAASGTQGRVGHHALCHANNRCLLVMNFCTQPFACAALGRPTAGRDRSGILSATAAKRWEVRYPRQWIPGTHHRLLAVKHTQRV